MVTILNPDAGEVVKWAALGIPLKYGNGNVARGPATSKHFESSPHNARGWKEEQQMLGWGLAERREFESER